MNLISIVGCVESRSEVASSTVAVHSARVERKRSFAAVSLMAVPAYLFLWSNQVPM